MFMYIFRQGASFVTASGRFEYTIKEIDSIFDTVCVYVFLIFFKIQRLLSEDVLDELDEYATDVFVSANFKRNSYKTVSEVVTLCCLTLLRDVLRPFDIIRSKTEISEKFAKEVDLFIFI